jgi:hypothetical protein
LVSSLHSSGESEKRLNAKPYTDIYVQMALIGCATATKSNARKDLNGVDFSMCEFQVTAPTRIFKA